MEIDVKCYLVYLIVSVVITIINISCLFLCTLYFAIHENIRRSRTVIYKIKNMFDKLQCIRHSIQSISNILHVILWATVCVYQ
jgi:hypothetical protein